MKLEERVAERFGIVPNFFTLTPEQPEITESLWGFACFAYLDNPLPSLFKERLFVYLSRFCDVRYCIIRHIGFLVGLGRPAGDKDVPPETIERVLQLIRRPLPRLDKMNVHVETILALSVAPVNLASLEDETEEPVFFCATHVFLQTANAPESLEALRQLLDTSQLQYLLVFLTFVRAAHYWSKVQTALGIEKDVQRLLANNGELAEAIWNDPEMMASEAGQGLLNELYQLRNSQADIAGRMAEELADSKRLQQLSGRLIEEQNVERLYKQIIEAAMAVMHSDFASLQLYVPEKEALHLLAYSGFHHESAKFWEWVKMAHSTTCGMALATRERVILWDVEHSDLVAGTKDLEYFRLSSIRSVQSTPLISRSGEIVGILSNHWREVHQPSDREFALLDVIIRQAADLLEATHSRTALRENQNWLNGQKEAFQAAMSGLPLTVSLKALVDTVVEQTHGEGRAAFYLIPRGGDGLHHVVGMPEEYAGAINGFEIGPESLACGLAMYTGEPVIYRDVEQEPVWEPWRPLARKFNYRGCWSFPVRTKGGPVVGTLAIYFSEPRQPTAREMELAGVLTHAASIIISRDRELMERTQAEEALRESEQKLKTLLRLRDEFIDNASHELKTPLTSIMVYAEMLEKHFTQIASSVNADMMHKLRFQVKRMNQLVRDMLDTTRVAEGKLVLELSHFDLAALLRDKAEELQRITGNHRIVTRLTPMEAIEADRERIGQVISNIVSNAIKYSPHGGEIVLACKHNGDCVEVSVSDQGIGIPADALERVFERFYRVESMKVQALPGMGIGLSICQGIIDMHGGRIAVESQEGSGSTFRFMIPMRQRE